jgi:hypothetical protein
LFKWRHRLNERFLCESIPIGLESLRLQTEAADGARGRMTEDINDRDLLRKKFFKLESCHANEDVVGWKAFRANVRNDGSHEIAHKHLLEGNQYCQKKFGENLYV